MSKMYVSTAWTALRCAVAPAVVVLLGAQAQAQGQGSECAPPAVSLAQRVSYDVFAPAALETSSTAEEDQKKGEGAYKVMSAELWEAQKNHGGFFNVYDREETLMVQDSVRKHHPRYIVDVGCGTGQQIRSGVLPMLTADERRRVVCIDVNADFVAHGDKAAQKSGLGGSKWIVGNMFEADFQRALLRMTDDWPAHRGTPSHSGFQGTPPQRLVLFTCNIMGIFGPDMIPSFVHSTTKLTEPGDIVVVCVQHDKYLRDAFHQYYRQSPETCGADISFDSDKMVVSSELTGYMSKWFNFNEVVTTMGPDYELLRFTQCDDGRGLFFEFRRIVRQDK